MCGLRGGNTVCLIRQYFGLVLGNRRAFILKIEITTHIPHVSDQTRPLTTYPEYTTDRKKKKLFQSHKLCFRYKHKPAYENKLRSIKRQNLLNFHI